MTNFNYVAKQRVRAAQWKGDNLDEMKALLKGVVDDDFDGEPCVYSDYIEPFFYASGSKTIIDRVGYYMLKTELDEFDPGVWVVVYDDDEIEGMDDEQFNKMFKKE